MSDMIEMLSLDGTLVAEAERGATCQWAVADALAKVPAEFVIGHPNGRDAVTACLMCAVRVALPYDMTLRTVAHDGDHVLAVVTHDGGGAFYCLTCEANGHTDGYAEDADGAQKWHAALGES